VPVALALLLVISAALLLRSWREGIPNRNDEKYEEILRDPPPLPTLARHLREAAPIALYETFLPNRWGLFFVAAPLVLLAGRRGLRHRPSFVLLVLAASGPLLGVAAYAVHWNPSYLTTVTWNRFLLHGSMGTLLLVSLALRPLYLATTNRRGG